MKQVLLGLLVSLTLACNALPVAPTPEQRALIPVAYDINVPAVSYVQRYTESWPNGVFLSPVEAQHDYDFTASYKGTPNVYAGTQSPACNSYNGVGIVIAPLSVASVRTFTAAQWPTLTGLDPTATYQWVGRFVYAQPATPQESMPCRQ